MTWSIWFEMLWISRSRALVFSFLHLSSLVNVRLSPALGSAQNWIVPRPGHPRSHGAASWAVLQVLQDHAPPNATAWRMFVTPWSVPR